MTPGPIGINAATFVGTKIAGVGGAVCATVGFVTPSFFIGLALARIFLKYGDIGSVRGILNGLRPAVVALIAVPCLTTARSIRMSHKALIIPMATALLIWLGGVSPVWVILAAIAGGLFYGLKIKKE